MKKSLPLIIVCACLSLLAACDKGSDNSSAPQQQVFAQTPVLNCNLPGSTNCNPGVYQQQGWQVTSYQYSYQNGFCGCAAGTRPVISPQYGVGCAPAGVFSDGNTYAGYSTPVNNHWTNIPQVTYSPAVSGSTGNCYADAARSCSVRDANACGGNGSCRPVGGGSDLGLCTVGYGTENYEAPRNCGYVNNGWSGWQYVCSGSNYGYGYGYGYGGGGIGTPR